ncbi:MAG: cyclic nucleotide-binding/CBS domain-containing protein [Candidatus Hodarchaeota archaeon]
MLKFSEESTRIKYIDISEEAFVCDPSAPASEIAKAMVDHWIDTIFVVNKQEELLGVITDGIMLSLIAKKRKISDELTAEKLMVTPVYSVMGNEHVHSYEKLKKTFSKRHSRVNRVAIIDENGKLIGSLNMGFLKKIGRYSRTYDITLKKKDGTDSNE